MAIVMCFEPINAHCAIRPNCVLRRALQKAYLAFVDVLDGYTLGDLAKPKGAAAHLAIDSAGQRQTNIHP
jgi:Rrf2 family nitric oxide-sensitive transcriptional repressor